MKSASEGIRKNLEFLKKNGNRVVFNAVFSKETFDFFDTALVDFALDYSIYEIGVLLDLDPAFYKKKKASDIVNRLMEIYTYGKSRGVIVTGYWHMIFQRMIVHDHFKYNRFKTCSATGCQLSIEPSGDVFACKASSGYFGHISKIEDLLSSNTYKGYALRTFRNASECAGCEIESFCSGFCLGPLEKKYKTIHVVEKSTCKVYKEMTRRLILDIERDSIENYRMRGKYQ
ncbi:MAG: SPASM domain-containing protein [Nitrospirae bacterium]|nr:SPASM domain-containing protein [Nitrospirota bacterium]